MENRYQTGGARFLAGILDGFVFMPFNLLDEWLSSSITHELALASWVALSFQVYWLYSVILHKKYGQTLGKMVMKIHVVDVSETKGLSYRQSFLRDSVYIGINVVTMFYYLFHTLTDSYTEDRADTIGLAISLGSLFWFGLEIITMLTNSKRRALHDYIAGTVVIKQ
ncbi:RDD family protein [Puniceicoccaceae bacterium K14]|nr:RDD family protein [Puniceicoccaceae bacterium K14]